MAKRGLGKLNNSRRSNTSLRSYSSKIDKGRKERSKKVRVKETADSYLAKLPIIRALVKEIRGDDQVYKFVAQSLGSGKYHRGYIRLKPNNKIEVSCSCEDYKYRWEVANTKAGISKVKHSNGKDPVMTNPDLKVSLCKHLLVASKMVRSSIDYDAS